MGGERRNGSGDPTGRPAETSTRDEAELPAAYEREAVDAPLAVRPVHYGASSSRTAPRYPPATTSLARRNGRPEQGGPATSDAIVAAEDESPNCYECSQDDEDEFGDSPGGHVTLPPDSLRDRLAAIFGGAGSHSAGTSALELAPVRAEVKPLAGSRPARLLPEPHHERNRKNGTGGGDA